jgi:RNA methyltransferase, RsmD family
MRVIAGTRRSLPLKSIEGMDTRPTADRYKETLFNVLQDDIPGSRFLDLFSGSGAIGIEALSRGAKHAVLVENGREALKCIKENVHFTKFEDEADILRSDAVGYVRSLPKIDFDVIFIDPPYGRGLEKDVLLILDKKEFKNEEAIIVVEATLEEDFSYLENTKFVIYKEKLYRTNKHVFIRLREAE